MHPMQPCGHFMQPCGCAAPFLPMHPCAPSGHGLSFPLPSWSIHAVIPGQGKPLSMGRAGGITPMRAPFHYCPHVQTIVNTPPPSCRVGRHQPAAPAGGSAKAATIAPTRTARFGRSVRRGRGRRGSRGGRGRKVCMWCCCGGGEAEGGPCGEGAAGEEEGPLEGGVLGGVMGLGKRETCDPLFTPVPPSPELYSLCPVTRCPVPLFLP